MLRALIGMATFSILAAAYALWPVCVVIPHADLSNFRPPITDRTERDWHGKVFQLRGDQWYQCKTRIARAYFF